MCPRAVVRVGMLKTVEDPQLQFIVLGSRSWTRLLTCPLLGTSGCWVRLLTCPLLCNDRCVVELVQETVEVPQLRCFDKVVDVPVVLVQLVEDSAGAVLGRRSSTRGSTLL